MKKNWKKDTEHLDLVSFSQPPESNKSTTIMASSPTVNHHQFSPTNHQQFSPTNQSSPTINLTHHVLTHHKHQPTPLTSPSNHSTPSELQSENEEPTPQNHNLSKCKRKINFPTFPPNKHQPATVARRNARERNRVKQVNNGFASLKQHIPPEHRAKKMSKVETLRCAVDYIRRLQVALNMSGRKSEGKGSVYGSMMDFESSYGGQSSEHLSLSPSSSDDPGEKRSFAHGSLSQGPDASSSATSPLGLCEYDNYDAVTSGDEDEFLDAFAIWQQS